MRSPASFVPIAHVTYTRPKCLLLRFVSIVIHCLSKTDAPFNGVVAIKSSCPLCWKLQVDAADAPCGRTAIPMPERGSAGLTLCERKKCSPDGRYENMYGRTTA